MSERTIYIASDHRGFGLKDLFVTKLRERELDVTDLGPDNGERTDASMYAVKLAKSLKKDVSGLGVLICGTGQMMAMTANRYKHIRAALCTDTTMARMAREHNDANVLVLGSHVVGVEVASDCLDVFLTTDFSGGRYAERVRLLADLGGL
jgi:ribose 5-phosphate isomerase B